MVALTDVAGRGGDDILWDILLDGDRVVVAGYSTDGSSNDAVVCRFDEYGELDRWSGDGTPRRWGNALRFRVNPR